MSLVPRVDFLMCSRASSYCSSAHPLWLRPLHRLGSEGCRSFNKLLRSQFLHQRLRFLQIARVKPLGEPPVNRSQQFARFAHLVLVAPEAREANGGAEFPGLGLLLAGDSQGALQASHLHMSDPKAVPIPSTFMLDMSGRLQDRGVSLGFYSPYPFPSLAAWLDRLAERPAIEAEIELVAALA